MKALLLVFLLSQATDNPDIIKPEALQLWAQDEIAHFREVCEREGGRTQARRHQPRLGWETLACERGKPGEEYWESTFRWGLLPPRPLKAPPPED